MILVGLGNPGGQYALNRHNVGFMAIDVIADQYSAPPFRKKFKAEISDVRLGGKKVLLMKPQTFMNSSGEAVQKAAHFYKTAPEDIIVIHDELDLDPMRIKTKIGGGHAGHNGLRSIDSQLGTKDYKRLRIGIGHPGNKAKVHGYVLGNYAKTEIDPLSDLLGAIADNIDHLIAGDDGRFVGDVSRLTRKE